MKLIYIGDKYYYESNTKMSSLYHEGSWKRSDWGLVQSILSRGEDVYIRHATPAELKKADAMLEGIKR
jgi:hypothetical protein